MKKSILILSMSFGLSCMFLSSCKKEKDTKTADCSPNVDIARELLNEPVVVVKESDGTFFLIEQETIDTMLEPCNLPAEFQVDGLEVSVSGAVKTYTNEDFRPCCIERFVVTKIEKR